MPHWEGTTFQAIAANGSRVCDNTCINQARSTIQKVVSRRKIGLLAECASIGVIEGAASTYSWPFGWWYPDLSGQPNFTDPANGYPDAGLGSTPGQYPTQIATCGQAGNADAGYYCQPPTATAKPRGVLHEIDPNGNLINAAVLRNCTDPNLASGSNCAAYAVPGDPYSQIGDQKWMPRSGLLSNFLPYTGSMYVSTWQPLSFAIENLDTTRRSTITDLRGQVTADMFSYTTVVPPSGDPSAASPVLYLGGHSYSSDIAGTRVVLNTLLALASAPVLKETGIAAPTGYNGNVFVATYNRVTSQGAQPWWSSYLPQQGSSFQYPYHTGYVRAHPLFGSGALQSGANLYTDNTAFNGDNAQSALPAPGARNIFTYIDGVISASPALGTGHVTPSGGLQTGWTAVDIDYTSAVPGSCVDKFGVSRVDSTLKPTYAGPSYAGLVPVSGGDGACDLSEMLDLTAVDLGTDQGLTNGVKGGSIPKAINVDAVNHQELLQLVRGYCYATSTHTDGTGSLIAHPAATDCNFNYNGHGNLQNNAAAFGGVIHSQPAIIPTSALIKDLPSGKHRPTVLYVGGLDGMLHALNVPSDGNDAGYTEPASTLHFLNSDATGTFHTSYSGAFSDPRMRSPSSGPSSRPASSRCSSRTTPRRFVAGGDRRLRRLRTDWRA